MWKTCRCEVAAGNRVVSAPCLLPSESVMPTTGDPSRAGDLPDHPDDQTLLAVLLGDAPPELAERVRQRSAASPVLAQRLAELRTLLADLPVAITAERLFRTTPAQRAALHASVRAALAEQPAADPTPAAGPPTGPTLGEAARQLIQSIGELILDTWAAPEPALGYRNAADPSAERVLRYRFPTGQVDIRVVQDAHTPDLWWVQCDAGDTAIHHAELRPLLPPAAPVACTLGDAGYADACVDPGVYRLVLRTAEALLVIDHLPVGRPGTPPPSANPA
jgi:hypothetical protein